VLNGRDIGGLYIGGLDIFGIIRKGEGNRNGDRWRDRLGKEKREKRRGTMRI
jgi:hypothetical protein